MPTTTSEITTKLAASAQPSSSADKSPSATGSDKSPKSSPSFYRTRRYLDLKGLLEQTKAGMIPTDHHVLKR